jgi:hypothetical protein
MNVELARIEESKLTLTPELQATVDEILLIMANDDKDTAVEAPTVEVKESHKEKMQARLDNVLLAFTNKNTELTALSTKIIDILDALKLVK